MKTVYKKFSEMHEKLDEKLNSECAKFSDLQKKGIAADAKLRSLKDQNSSAGDLAFEETMPISEEDELVQNEF